jgi:hypothetical protein
VKLLRSFRDGHEEAWCALEVDVGPYGPQRERRAVVATTDPESLPDKSTWYLVSNLPYRDSDLAIENELAASDLSEIVRLYGLRMWVEQSYKQVEHALGWSDYQVRGDVAIRRLTRSEAKRVRAAFGISPHVISFVLLGDAVDEAYLPKANIPLLCRRLIVVTS